MRISVAHVCAPNAGLVEVQRVAAKSAPLSSLIRDSDRLDLALWALNMALSKLQSFADLEDNVSRMIAQASKALSTHDLSEAHGHLRAVQVAIRRTFRARGMARNAMAVTVAFLDFIDDLVVCLLEGGPSPAPDTSPSQDAFWALAEAPGDSPHVPQLFAKLEVVRDYWNVIFDAPRGDIDAAAVRTILRAHGDVGALSPLICLEWVLANDHFDVVWKSLSTT